MLRSSFVPATVLVTTLFAAAALGPMARAQSADGSPVVVSITAQPLGQALNALAAQGNLQMAFPPALVAGKVAPAVSGTMTVRQALDRLLAGSGLVASINGSSVIIRAAAPAASAGDGSLPVVTVVGVADRGLQPRTASTLGPLGTLSVLDAPYSVDVITQDMIRNENPTRLTEALRYVPGVINNQPGGSYYDQVMVRGLDLSQLSNYRKNNMPLVIRGDTAFENIERLELYKGPSAMFYGFSSPGGVINYVTKRPPASGFLAGGQLQANGFGGWGASADVGGRFGQDGQFGYRVNLGYEDIANHIRDFNGRRDVQSIALDWRASAATRVEFDYEQQYKRTQIQPGIGVADANQIPASVDPRKFLGQSWTYHAAQSRNTMLQVTHALSPDWSVRLAGNYLDLDRPYKYSNVGLDDKATGNGAAFFGILDNQFDAWSGVFQVDGKVRTGGITHDLVLGYSPQRVVYRELRAFPGGAAFNIYQPTALAEPFAAFGPERLSTFSNRSTYLMDRVTLSERWQAIIGFRHNDYGQTFTGQPTYEKRKTTPTFGLTYKPAPNVSIYGSYMEGLERGGVAPLTAINAGQLMAPLASRQYEVGAKAELARGITLTGALFRITRPSEFANASREWVQDGKQVNQGVELGVAGRVTRNLSLYGGITLLDAKLQETGTPALNGKSPAGVPKRALSLYADYHIPGTERWSVNGGLIHVGSRPVFADNSGSVPAYTLLNLGSRYEFKTGGVRTRILLSIDNLANRFYWDTVDSFGTLTIGVPRTVRVAAQFLY